MDSSSGSGGGFGDVGPQRTYCYNMKNNMTGSTVKVGPEWNAVAAFEGIRAVKVGQSHVGRDTR